MTVPFIHWPGDVLPPAEVVRNMVAFSRSGGRTLGGIERTTRTDRGFWTFVLDQVPVHSREQHRVWNALRAQLAGRAGLIAIPVWAFKSAPYVSGNYEQMVPTEYSDDTLFSDGTSFVQGSISVSMATTAPLGSTVVVLSAINASSVAGVGFSYQHAYYETGPIISQPTETIFQVSISPAIRHPIPAGSTLEVNEPTCLCHLRDDAGMDISEGITPLLRKSVEFVEAVDVWNDIALGILPQVVLPPAVVLPSGFPSMDFSQINNSQYIPSI